MTIRHLTVFAAVAEQGSMSAAAKHLYLSQPSANWKLIITDCSLNVLEKSFILQTAGSFFFPMHVT